MNPMIAALQSSRQAAPEAPLSPDAAAPAAAAGPGDALLGKLAGIEAKLDQICAALKVGGAGGDEPAGDDATEATPHDDGY